MSNAIDSFNFKKIEMLVLETRNIQPRSKTMNPQQKQQKVHLENFKQSINQWVTDVPNLTTPHYNEGDDLMNPEAYDKIRELILNDLLLLSGRDSSVNQFREYPFYENWQIDRNLNKLISFTQEWIHRSVECPTAKKIELACCEIRNIIENNLPFTVFYFISNAQSNFRGPYTHSVYKNSKTRHSGTGGYVMRPEEEKLFGIIINQDSKIKQLEERIERMESWNRQNIQDKQTETKKLSEMFASLVSRIESINGINDSVKTLSYLVQKDKKELLGQISNLKKELQTETRANKHIQKLHQIAKKELEKQLLDIDRKIHKMKNHKQNNVPADDLIDLSLSNNPFDEFQ